MTADSALALVHRMVDLVRNYLDPTQYAAFAQDMRQLSGTTTVEAEVVRTDN